MKIDLNDWIKFSSRKNSNSYISKDGKWYLKASPNERDFNIDELKQTQTISNICNELGISTPKVGEIVEMPDGTFAIIYEYINNKCSYSRYIENKPDSIEYMMKKFAAEAKKFHSIAADTSLIEPFTTKLESVLLNTDVYTGEEKTLILNKVKSLPTATTVLHGDFQPSNILISGDKSYFIDLGMLTYGNPLFDIGFLWFVVMYSNDRVYQRVFHASKDKVLEMWKIFATEYFGIEDINMINNMVRPYGLSGISIILGVMPKSGFILYNKEEILEECRNI